MAYVCLSVRVHVCICNWVHLCLCVCVYAFMLKHVSVEGDTIICCMTSNTSASYFICVFVNLENAKEKTKKETKIFLVGLEL